MGITYRALTMEFVGGIYIGRRNGARMGGFLLFLRNLYKAQNVNAESKKWGNADTYYYTLNAETKNPVSPDVANRFLNRYALVERGVNCAERIEAQNQPGNTWIEWVYRMTAGVDLRCVQQDKSMHLR